MSAAITPEDPSTEPRAALAADAPTLPSQRLISVDIIRGIALLGIFSVNMLFFSGDYGFFGVRAATTSFETWLEGFIRIFAQGAFYSLFSFLFGLGLALQLRRGSAAIARFRRRLAVLLVIGALHAIFIWYGDILVSYAFGGFVLLLFARQKSWLIGLASAFLFGLSSLFYLTDANLNLMQHAPWLTQARFNAVMSQGTYLEVVGYQLNLLQREVLNMLNFLPTILWLFLLGLLAGRHQLFDAPNTRFWRGTLLIALPVALVFKGFVAYWYVEAQYSPLNRGYSFAIGGPALMVVYLSSLVLLLHHKRWQERLGFFASVGKMALSNYLAQSLICTLIFHGYGLGYFNQLSLSTSYGILLAIFAAQVFFSNLWLRVFRFGPAEWVWRSLTYGKAQPLRR